MADREMLREWQKHPGTIYLVQELDQLRKQLALQWEEGGFTGATADTTVQLNSRALGRSQGYADIKDFIESINEDTND